MRGATLECRFELADLADVGEPALGLGERDQQLAVIANTLPNGAAQAEK